jgi:hypothetical protein
MGIDYRPAHVIVKSGIFGEIFKLPFAWGQSELPAGIIKFLRMQQFFDGIFRD